VKLSEVTNTDAVRWMKMRRHELTASTCY